jgi:hypothetical protein
MSNIGKGAVIKSIIFGETPDLEHSFIINIMKEHVDLAWSYIKLAVISVTHARM